MSALTIEMDAAEVIAALSRLGEAATPYVRAAAGETARIIAREARSRLARQIGTSVASKTRADLGQHLTLSGIGVRADTTGAGYLVVSEREPFPNLPLWLEKGTKPAQKGDGSGGNMPARPYFYASAQLEESAHFRRIEEAVQQALAETGLGE